MLTRAVILVTALLCADPLIAKPAKSAQPVPGIAVGEVLDDSLGQTVKGWYHAAGAMFSRFDTKGNVTTASLDCCIAILTRGKSTIVALTRPLTRNPDGGVIKEKVIALKRIDLRPGEIGTSCSLFSLQILYSVRNPATKQVRSVIIDNGELATLEWRDTANRCGEEGP